MIESKYHIKYKGNGSHIFIESSRINFEQSQAIWVDEMCSVVV